MPNRAQRRRAGQRGTSVQPRGGVLLAVPTAGNPEPQFLRSIALLLVWDAQHAGHVVRHGAYLQREATDIAHQRNQIVKLFLEGGWEWLCFVDDDMEFQESPDILDRLLESADPVERPIVGALCFARLRGQNQEIVPTIYGMRKHEDGTAKLIRSTGYPRNQLFQVAATGTGCVLIHRRVFVELARRWYTPSPWFNYMPWENGNTWGVIPGTDIAYAGPADKMGEDITFMMRCGSAHGERDDYDGNGETFPVYVDTRIRVGHVKRFVVDEALFDRFHPAYSQTAPTFVVIPVRGQHQYTESLLRQLAAQREYTGIFVYDNGADEDPYTGFVPDQCEVIPAAGLNIHQMWNLGVRKAQQLFSHTNIAILNNDLNIGPHFLDGLSVALRSQDALFAVSPNYDGRRFDADIQGVQGIAAGKMDGTGGLAGFAFMVKGEIFDHGFPLFDEQYELWYGDNDFTIHVMREGGILGIVRDTTVEHIDGGSKTAGDGTSRLKSPELKAMAERDRVRFETKWSVETVPA